MVFANLLFIYLFLPLNLILYFLSKRIVYRNLVLVAFSFVFYTWGEPVWFMLLLTSAAFDYMHGRLIGRFRGTWMAKAAVASSLALNLSLLGSFKYSGFIVQTVNDLLGTSFGVPAFALPIGISFYTFQTISYVVDVYRGDTEAQSNPVYYLLYLSMYHQLVAGPVVRYADVAREIRSRTVDAASFSEGLTRFVFGLAKKVLVANAAGSLADTYMATAPANLSVGAAWFGAALFTLQIYYDFSGYSDMAIGLGRILAALAHLSVKLLSRLCLHPARRKPKPSLPQSVCCMVSNRAVARRFLEFYSLGAVLWGVHHAGARFSWGMAEAYSGSVWPCVPAASDAYRLGHLLFYRSRSARRISAGHVWAGREPLVGQRRADHTA